MHEGDNIKNMVHNTDNWTQTPKCLRNSAPGNATHDLLLDQQANNHLNDKTNRSLQTNPPPDTNQNAKHTKTTEGYMAEGTTATNRKHNKHQWARNNKNAQTPLDFPPQKQTHAQKLIEHIRANEQPPELHKLNETDLRFITEIMIQIAKNPFPDQINQENKKNLHKQLCKCPTCPYIGEQEHHLIKHRQKRHNVRNYGNKKNKDGNALKGHAKKSFTRKIP